MTYKAIALALTVLIAAVGLGACANEASVASQNLSTAADNFEVNRRVTFINGITDHALLVIEGLCSLGKGTETKSLTVTCKTGPGQYKKHFLGLSDNVTYVSEQLDSIPASPFHYRVTFNPSTILPDIQLAK